MPQVRIHFTYIWISLWLGLNELGAALSYKYLLTWQTIRAFQHIFFQSNAQHLVHSSTSRPEHGSTY